MKRALFPVALVMTLAMVAFGQMHGGSPGGGMAGSSTGRPSMGGMQGGSQSGMGSAGQNGSMVTPAQRRQLLHTTAMQDQKYQACTRAMSKVQGDLSRMQAHGRGNLSSAQTGNSSPDGSADAQQSDPGDDLSSDLQDMAQSDDDLTSSLNADQQAVVAGKLKDIDEKTKEMQSLAEQLKSETGNAETNSKTVREHIKKLNKLSKEIAKEQHEIAAALGITS